MSEGAWRGAGARTRLSVPATWRATTFLSWCQIVQVSKIPNTLLSPLDFQNKTCCPHTRSPLPQHRATLLT